MVPAATPPPTKAPRMDELMMLLGFCALGSSPLTTPAIAVEMAAAAVAAAPAAKTVLTVARVVSASLSEPMLLNKGRAMAREAVPSREEAVILEELSKLV